MSNDNKAEPGSYPIHTEISQSQFRTCRLNGEINRTIHR